MKYLGMTIHCIGIVLAGMWFFNSVFSVIRPYTENFDNGNLKIDFIKNKVLFKSKIRPII